MVYMQYNLAVSYHFFTPPFPNGTLPQAHLDISWLPNFHYEPCGVNYCVV